MTDTISRQAAIDAIKAKRLWHGKYLTNSTAGYDYAVDVLKELPSAQPEIIHCGECTKMQVDSIFNDCWCEETGREVWVNHYCGYAERREE